MKKNLKRYIDSESFKDTVGYYIKNIDFVISKEGDVSLRAKSGRSLRESKDRMYRAFELDWKLPHSELHDVKYKAWHIIEEAIKDSIPMLNEENIKHVSEDWDYKNEEFDKEVLRILYKEGVN